MSSFVDVDKCVLQGVAVVVVCCGGVLWSVVGCGGVQQGVVLQWGGANEVLYFVALYKCALHCVAGCCGVLQWVAVGCSGV